MISLHSGPTWFATKSPHRIGWSGGQSKVHIHFRLTKKKVTWLATPSTDNPLVNVSLLDYDYLITKKKLEEGDVLGEFVTPVTEFREDAFADPNVLELSSGAIIQFERKGYYILDGKLSSEEEDGKGTLQFIRIPDGKLSSLASKAVAHLDTSPHTASSV